MKIDVISFDEEQRIISIEIDDEAKQLLLEVGFNKILSDGLSLLVEKNKENEQEVSV